ncbi:heme-binding protein [Grimontia sp. S25]|uniref:Heme-binding protein n=1 Tax=Grimontia sedimenti TaxID=2711294 RepID=A0A6M1RFE3_9GAMM|nr:heme-binding protein [Grimontia sedimenti]NGN96319.1 heme-binding protein [Grimontia sedimenti]
MKKRYQTLSMLSLLTCMAFVSGNSFANVINEPTISLDMALKAAKAANDRCLKDGFKPTTTVVDQRGQMKVQLNSDGAFPHAVETSYRKALTAASRREATSIIEAENEHEPQLGAVFNEIGLITLSGGIPIYYKGQVIGAIGVAGAPGENDEGIEYDDICAEHGIKSISKELKG